MSELNATSGKNDRPRPTQGRRLWIEDIPAVGEELNEEHLRFISGGECSCGNSNATNRVQSTPNDCSASCD